MNRRKAPGRDIEYSKLSPDPKERHEAFVDVFGQVIFWLRNWSITASQKLVESESSREELGTIRREYYEGVANMAPEHREAALLLAQDNLDGFIERLIWILGDEGIDCRIGDRHAYRFRIEMEIVDVESEDIVEEETINRGGKFFGKYWGHWLNRYGIKL